MRQPEFTDTVRRELGETALAAPEPEAAARMAQRVLRTRARRRQRRLVGAAAAAVVLALGAATIVTTQSTSSQVQAVPVTQWPARGALADNLGLVERARQAWGTRAARVVFAGTSTEVGTVVVLSSVERDGEIRLAFLTAAPELQVRAQLSIPADQVMAPAFGFVSSEPDRALGVVVTAPGVTTAWFSSSAADTVSVQPVDGLAAAVLAPAAAAWNTAIATGGPQHPDFGELTSSSHDPAVSPGTVARAGTDTQFAVFGVDAKPGDVVATRAGLVGVVTTADGDLAGLNFTPPSLWGLRTTTASGEPVTLTRVGSLVDDPIAVTPAGPGVREGDRIVLSGFGRSAGVVVLGTVHAGRLLRAVPTPPTGAKVLVIRR
ncbi:hypothetical protein QRX50_07545 [Amycolatopsis carbonis]|uniref:Uncharacterized protein n=1 Tax=Amycolatopsis carbonis TaxID=715471 RepID=A0A9Y2IIW6_9PSEU|nr:hypothetical protein [Amycolatopsis sp. 2-15]WIX80612.1 hypothetical protein QRX50_07545 [Amycolatopsis sp. 2-15]